MSKSESFAIATQQAHAAGKAPKGYGTPEGKAVAKQKYDDPKSSYKQTAAPKTKHSSSHEALWSGFMDELQKIAAAAATMGSMTKTIKMPPTHAKMTSKPVTREPDPPAATLDHFSSSRTIQPPPATMAGS